MARSVVLLSGGLDSGTALALHLAEGHEVVLCLTADYTQRAYAPEAAHASRLAARFHLPWQSLALHWLGDLSRRAGSALVDPSIPLPTGTRSTPGDATSAASVWIPCRNLVLVAAAAAHAETLGADTIVTGFNAEEAITFPDNSAAFTAAATTLLQLASRTPLQLHSPTLALTKPDIAAAARRLGLEPADFWSCYDVGPLPCQRCESCLRSARAWGTREQAS